MQLAQLQIQQTMAQIGIRQEMGSLRLRQPQAQLNFQSEQVQVQLETEQGGLSIDQSRAWAAYALIPATQLTSMVAKQSQEVAYEAIAQYARDGDRLAAIHQSANLIPQLAKERAAKGLYPLKFTAPASSHNVDIRYTPDHLSISFSGGTVKTGIEPQDVYLEYTPGQTQIGMVRYPSIQFEVKGSQFDTYY